MYTICTVVPVHWRTQGGQGGALLVEKALLEWQKLAEVPFWTPFTFLPLPFK